MFTRGWSRADDLLCGDHVRHLDRRLRDLVLALERRGTDDRADGIYSATRAAPLPSTNAIASIFSLITLASVHLGYAGYRVFTRGEREAGQGMVGDMAAFDI